MRKHRRTLIGALIVIVLLVLGWRWLFDKPAAKSTVPAAVAVDSAPVKSADVPIYNEGLGTVQAFYTVTLTARVDGQLQKIGFTEGQMVHKGDLLAQIDPRSNQAAYEQAVATKAKDAAQLTNAQRDLERYRVLQPQDLASKQTFDTQRALVDQLGAQLQVDQAQIDNARTQLDYTRITSPIEGRTGIRLIDPGNIVHAADTTGIVVVTQMQPISLIFSLPEDDLAGISAALAAGAVTVIALSRDDSTELAQGVLALIDNEIDQPTGTIKLKATFTNDRNTLWPGEFVNARVRVRTDRNVLTLPSSAVQHGPDGAFTYVVTADSSVEARPIKVREASGDNTVVDSGLALNERVVTSNQYRLQPGTRVRSAAPATNAAASPPAGARKTS